MGIIVELRAGARAPRVHGTLGYQHNYLPSSLYVRTYVEREKGDINTTSTL